MLLSEILLEKISTPYAYDVFDIIKGCGKAATDEVSLRNLLQSQLQNYFSEKFASVKKNREADLVVIITPHVKNLERTGASGAFISPDSREKVLKDHPDLPEFPKGSTAIYLFVDGLVAGEIMDGLENAISRATATMIHEYVHVVQWVRSNKSSAKFVYTAGLKRQKVDGTRRGKRFVPDDTPNSDKANYYAMDIEIDAHASSAATQIMLLARKEPPEKQKEFINKAIRSLRVMSGSVMQFRELFDKIVLNFFAKIPTNMVKDKAMKQVVWKRFRLKVAKHLMEYLSEAAGKPTPL